MRKIFWSMVFLLLCSHSHAELSISDIGTKKIMRGEYINLIENFATKICEVNAKDYNFPKNDCREYVISKTDKCVSKNNIKLPESITNRNQVDGYLVGYLMCSTPPPGYAGENERKDIPVPASSMLEALSDQFMKKCQKNGGLTVEYTNPVSCTSKSIEELKEKCLEVDRPKLSKTLSCGNLSSDMQVCKDKIKLKHPVMVNKEGSAQIAKDIVLCLIRDV